MSPKCTVVEAPTCLLIGDIQHQENSDCKQEFNMPGVIFSAPGAMGPYRGYYRSYRAAYQEGNQRPLSPCATNGCAAPTRPENLMLVLSFCEVKSPYLARSTSFAPQYIEWTSEKGCERVRKGSRNAGGGQVAKLFSRPCPRFWNT